jgi:tetratricopeptide (TPR) repeat protein
MEKMGWLKGAEEEFSQSLKIQKQLAADFPSVPDYRFDLAMSHYNLGILLSASRRPTDAEAAYRAAIALSKELVADFPTVLIYRRQLAKSYRGLGALLQPTNRLKEAEEAIRELWPFSRN